MISYLGEGSALLAAFSWALAVILFRKSGETVHPVALNMFKNTLAFVLFLPTMWVMGETLFRDVPGEEYALLILSGILGIGLSDTLFFMSLNRIGAGLSAIVDCLYSPFIIGLSVLWLGEVLNGVQILGVFMIVSAVLVVSQKKSVKGISRKALLMGILFGALAMASLAVSIVMVIQLLKRSPLLWVTEIRLIGGIISMIAVILIFPRRRAIIGSLLSIKGWFYTVSGSFVGAYLAMLFWLTGMKYALASVAAALNQTSNILVFIFAAWLLKERITAQKLVGIVVGVSGTLLVTFG